MFAPPTRVLIAPTAVEDGLLFEVSVEVSYFYTFAVFPYFNESLTSIPRLLYFSAWRSQGHALMFDVWYCQ